MSVPMQHHLHSSRSHRRRNVRQEKSLPRPTEFQRLRPTRIGIVVAEHYMHRLPKLLHLYQSHRAAHIAEVPNLIRPGQQPSQLVRQLVVSICNDRNTHARNLRRDLLTGNRESTPKAVVT